MELSREHKEFLSLVPFIVLWGCCGGILLAGENIFLQEIWTPLLPFNSVFYPVFQLQIIISSALLLWILGMMTADLILSGMSAGNRVATLTGFLCGTCSALVYVSILIYQDLLSHPPTVFYTLDFFQMRLFLDRLFHPWLITLAGFIIISGILQALGAWYRGARLTGTVRHSSRKSAFTTAIHRHCVVLLILIAVLVIPPGLAYLATGAGVIDPTPCCWTGMNDSVNVTRTGPLSLRIIMETDPDTERKTSVPAPFVSIYLDDKDFSNQRIITASGYHDRLEPPEGLRYQNGASLTVTGTGVSGNGTTPVHLMITIMYPDRKEQVVICDRDI